MPEIGGFNGAKSGGFNGAKFCTQRIERYISPDFKDWIILDEVQRVPELLNEVHRQIEKNRYKFILTGSSARKLKRSGPNLLAGRALTYQMHQLTSKELAKDFDLEHSLQYGQLPSAYVESDPKRYLESYVSTYLKEEVAHEGLTRNISAFSRFLEAASFSQGSVLNISSVARDCGIERKVVENYFSILEDLLVAYRIPCFTKSSKRDTAQHPKFYFFDAGVYRTIRPMGPLDMPEEVGGIALETLLFQELNAINDYLQLGYKIFYWRTKGGLEIDFVLYGERGIIAFEVKRSSRMVDPMFKGLKAFKKEYPKSKTYFVYGGDKKMFEGEIKIIPIDELLKDLASIL